MISNGYEVSLMGNENVLKLDSDYGCTTLNVLKKKPFELYILKGGFYCVNHISIKLLKIR